MPLRHATLHDIFILQVHVSHLIVSLSLNKRIKPKLET